jgi:hypothetical protein
MFKLTKEKVPNRYGVNFKYNVNWNGMPYVDEKNKKVFSFNNIKDANKFIKPLNKKYK